jgi:hypothetical protein
MKLGKLVLAVACAAVLSACDSGKPTDVFSAKYSAAQTQLTVTAGSQFTVPVTFNNSSTGTWNSQDPKTPVMPAYHLLDSDKQLVLQDGVRTPFAEVVAPNKEVTVKMNAEAPKKPGTYIMQVSLVQETVAWFESKNVKPLELTVTVK